MKKVSKNYVGICQLGQLHKGDLFTFVNKSKIYVLDYYDRHEKKYCYYDYNDINNYHFKKATTLVDTTL